MHLRLFLKLNKSSLRIHFLNVAQKCHKQQSMSINYLWGLKNKVIEESLSFSLSLSPSPLFLDYSSSNDTHAISTESKVCPHTGLFATPVTRGYHKDVMKPWNPDYADL